MIKTIANDRIHRKRKKDDQDYGDNEDVALLPHNRGHKLLRGAENVHGFKLRDAGADISPSQVVEYSDKKRVVVKGLDRWKKRIETDDKGNLTVVADSDSEDDAYADVKVDEIFTPIETPFDVVQRSCNRAVFKNDHMSKLINNTMEMIESESHFNRAFKRFASVLQGDDNIIGPHPDMSALPTALQIPGAAAAAPGADPEPVPTLAQVILGAQPVNPETVDEDRDSQQAKLESIQKTIMDTLNQSNELLERLVEVRDKIAYADRQKYIVYSKLKETAKEEKKMEKRRDMMAGR